MGNKSIVPFGKYKGQPVELMQNDIAYCDWLMTQNWFRDRYAPTYQLIVNNFDEPAETPEHNKLQALFLDDEMCRKLIFTLKWEPINDPIGYLEKEIESTKKNIEANSSSSYYREAKEKYQKHLKILEEFIKEDGRTFKESIKIVNRCFESCGWDVSFRAEFTIGNETDGIWIAVEIKPSIGDDYPAILRQMKSNAKRFWKNYEYEGGTQYYILVFQQCTAIGATLDNIKKIFNESGFACFQLQEITQS